MSTRTFQQMGRGYLSDQVSIVAKLDGEVIYSGTIPSVNELVPTLPDPDFDITDVIFSWEKDVDFSGQQQLEIAVTGGTLILTDTLANCVDPSDPSAFGNFYRYVDNDQTIFDPFSDEKIDGAAQVEDRAVEGGLYGQWWWIIPDGSVFTATINISAGIEPLPEDLSV